MPTSAASTFTTNKPFNEFLAELETRGVMYRWAWLAHRDGKTATGAAPPDVGMLQFSGRGFQPRHLAAIVVNHGDRDGFGLYFDSPHDIIAADADAIAGRDVSVTVEA